MHTEHTPQTQAQALALALALALAEAVVADGFDAHTAAVTGLVDDARLVGVTEILGCIALDGSQPTVARERALGRVVAAYVSALEHRAAPVGESIDDRFTVAA